MLFLILIFNLFFNLECTIVGPIVIVKRTATEIDYNAEYSLKTDDIDLIYLKMFKIIVYAFLIETERIW